MTYDWTGGDYDDSYKLRATLYGIDVLVAEHIEDVEGESLMLHIRDTDETHRKMGHGGLVSIAVSPADWERLGARA